MASDLDMLLAQAAGDLERQVADLPDTALGGVRTSVRRRRGRRHAVESFAAVSGVAVVGVVAWLGAVRGAPTPVPAETPSPSVTPTTSPTTETPTPAPSPTPIVAPPTAPADDVAGIARVTSPTTGETWQEPVAAPEMAAVLGADGLQEVFLVGHRGDAAIYVMVTNLPGLSTGIQGIYEAVGDQVTSIACPEPGRECAGHGGRGTGANGMDVDITTRYDSLTVPTAIQVSSTFGVTTEASRVNAFGYTDKFGDGSLLLGLPGDPRTLRQIGDGRLVELRSESQVPGLTPMTYAYVTPMGSLFRLDAPDVALADVSAIRWDDGSTWPFPADSGYRGTVAPGAPSCGPSTLMAVEAHHVNASWQAAGTTTDGRRVFIPPPGGNAASRAVFENERDTSWTMDGVKDVIGAAAYRLTEQQFLEQRSLYAVRGPQGEWLLGLRPDASATVWECW